MTLSSDSYRTRRTRFSLLRVVVLGCALLALIAFTMVASPVQRESTQRSLGEHTSVALVNGASKTPVKAVSKQLVPGTVLGVALNGASPIAGMPWVKLAYPTCGAGNPSGADLQNAIQSYHSKGVKVLLIYCQPQPSQLYNTTMLHDAAQARADAVQCGNEQMKNGKYNNYVSPANFAKFFDLCQGAMHTVNSSIPIVLGALDPHVAGYDYNLMMGQVNYLNQMQAAMNTRVHPHGNWAWRSQTLGIINSWHDGFPSLATNNLLGLFTFWANQFHVNLNSGALGQHLWVVEDTGCFKGCDNNINTKAKVAIAHIMALTLDTQTTMRYRVPFFFFSAQDFISQGVYWPIGVQDANGHAKPLRQDLRMGSSSLVLNCGKSHPRVIDQVTLLTDLYRGCSLQGNWYSTLAR